MVERPHEPASSGPGPAPAETPKLAASRRRRKTTLAWMGLFVTTFLVLLSTASSYCPVYWQRAGTDCLLADGAIEVGTIEVPCGLDGLHVLEVHGGDRGVWPQIKRGTWGTWVRLPLWAIALPPLAGTIVLWRRGYLPALPLSLRSRQLMHARCRSCGYDLTGNVSGLCPECGVGFAGEADVPVRCFLPWEHAYLGGSIRRTLSSWLHAWSHPVSHFVDAAARTNTPMRQAWPAVAWSFAVTVVISSAMWTARWPLSALVACLRGGTLRGFYASSLAPCSRSYLLYHFTAPLVESVNFFAATVICAYGIARFKPKALLRWRTRDVAALLSPFAAVPMALEIIRWYDIGVGWGYLVVVSAMAFWATTYWICGRRLLAISRTRTVVMVLFSLLALFAVATCTGNLHEMLVR